MTHTLPPKLVTAVDIAAERVRGLPTGSPQKGIAKAVAFQFELLRAKRELAEGLWELPAP